MQHNVPQLAPPVLVPQPDAEPVLPLHVQLLPEPAQHPAALVLQPVRLPNKRHMPRGSQGMLKSCSPDGQY